MLSIIRKMPLIHTFEKYFLTVFFVKISDSFAAPGIHSTLSTSFSRRSRINKCLPSTCLGISPVDHPLVRSTVPLLFTLIMIEVLMVRPIDSRICFTCIMCCTQPTRASASGVKRADHFCITLLALTNNPSRYPT